MDGLASELEHGRPARASTVRLRLVALRRPRVQTSLAAGWAGQRYSSPPGRRLTLVATGGPEEWRNDCPRPALPLLEELVPTLWSGP